MLDKTWRIVLNAAPVALMVALIPIIASDYLLAGAYLLITAVSFLIKRERHDCLVYALGLVAMTVSEYFFISTGVETFVRNSLFGIMPIWLPLLWAYGFVAIKRSVNILDTDGAGIINP